MSAIAPGAYLAARIYHHTHDAISAVGTAIACCFIVGTILGYWIEDASWVARTSAEDALTARRRWPLLLEALVAALVMGGAFLLLWWFVGVITRQASA